MIQRTCARAGALGVAVGVFFFVLSPAGRADDDQGRVELELDEVVVVKKPREISGAVFSSDGKRLLFVSDDEDQSRIFAVESGHVEDPKKGPMPPEISLDFGDSAPYERYRETVEKREKRVSKDDRRLDLEGMTRCGASVFVVSERVRHVLEITGEGVKPLSLDYGGVDGVWKGGANSGLEGIAADCKRGQLYLAKEKNPRMLLRVSRKGGTVKELKTVPPSDRAGQVVIEPDEGDGTVKVPDDYSGLFYEDGFLYALERFAYEVVKIRVSDMKPVARASFFQSGTGVFDSREATSHAESLVMNDDRIILGFDGGGEPFGASLARRLGYSGRFGVFFVYERPDGF